MHVDFINSIKCLNLFDIRNRSSLTTKNQCKKQPPWWTLIGWNVSKTICLHDDKDKSRVATEAMTFAKWNFVLLQEILSCLKAGNDRNYYSRQQCTKICSKQLRHKLILYGLYTQLHALETIYIKSKGNSELFCKGCKKVPDGQNALNMGSSLPRWDGTWRNDETDSDQNVRYDGIGCCIRQGIYFRF